MNIAILGAGNIGSNLARLLVRAGHDVVFANSRDPETLADLARDLGVKAVSATEVAKGANVIVVAIPMVNVAGLPPGALDGAAPGFTVIDATNYYPQRDGHIADIEEGLTESEWVAKQLGHTVVKAFNGIWYRHLLTHSRPQGDPSRRALPVAGDDEMAKTDVIHLLDDIGFDAVDAGRLDESWRMQPGQPVYGADTGVDGVKQLLAEAAPHRHADWTASGR